MKHLIPDHIRTKITESGFYPISYIEMWSLYSIVASREGKKYNIQLNKHTMNVVSIDLLKYRFNQSGAKIVDVRRISLQNSVI